MSDRCDDAIGLDEVEVDAHYEFMLDCAIGKDELANDPEIGYLTWGWRYDSVQDDRVCALCQSLDGVTLPKQHPFWKKYRPPHRRGCRCDRTIITVMDFERGDIEQTPEYLLPK